MTALENAYKQMDEFVKSRQNWENLKSQAQTNLNNTKPLQFDRKVQYRKAIRNAEDELKRIDKRIKDLTTSIEKLEKQQQKTERTEIKSQDNNILASQGIDPNASMWGGISSLGQSAGSAVSSVFGNSSPQAQTAQKNNMFLVIGLGVVALLLILKKSK